MNAQTALVLAELVLAAVAEYDAADVVASIGRQVARILPFERMSIMRWPAGADFVEVYAGTGDDAPSTERPRMPLHGTPWGEVIEARRVIVRSNAMEEDVYPMELHAALEGDWRSMMHVPLSSKGRIIGIMSLGSHKASRWSARHVAVAEEVAGYLSVVIDHTFMHDEIRKLAEVEERSRLARELHDALAQDLTGIVWQINAVRQQLDAAESHLDGTLLRIRDSALAALEESRRSVWNLRAGALDRESLASALRREIKRFQREAGIDCRFSVAGRPVLLSPGCATAALRIAQESLSNVRKHARASHVQVSLRYRGGSLRLVIADNGCGFDASFHVDRRRGFGLVGMTERARIAGGEILIETAPDSGTTVTATLPCEGK
ncbi:MAG: GAF domain-containing sensor histidine kinase [Chloroflexi bacterium]|nr:GAF domain-containing sensor histidine kinase [Chloroflexota bacterium]